MHFRPRLLCVEVVYAFRLCGIVCRWLISFVWDCAQMVILFVWDCVEKYNGDW